MALGSVYAITNTSSGKCYVGQTTRRVSDRWAVHKSEARRRPVQYIHKAIAQHGDTSFDIQTLGTAETRAELNNLERLWIVALRSSIRGFGYNLTFGGDGMTPTLETRAKMSASARVKHFTDTHRANIGKAAAGRKFSLEHRAKLSAANKGNKPSEYCVSRVAEANRSRVHSNETRAKLSSAARKANEVRWHRQK